MSIYRKIFSKGMTLKDYGKRNKTDKVNQYHSFAGKTYLDVYSLYLEPLKNTKCKMLEIGIKQGASLRTFRDYFKKWQIIGLDIDPGTAFKEPRITTYIGSQNSVQILDQIFSNHPEINVVIDDGSHINQLTIESFQLIFTKLPKGSFYIIEDLACTYLENNLESDIIRGRWPGMNYNDSTIEMVNKRSDIDSFVQNLLKDMDAGKGEIEFVHFWSQICIIKKIS